jgi:hypothetical protein
MSRALINAVEQFSTQLSSALNNGVAFRIEHDTPETMVPHFEPHEERGYELNHYGYDWEVRNVDGHWTLFAVEVSCDCDGSWDEQNTWQIDTPTDLRKIQRYMSQDLKRGLRTQLEYSRYVLMDTYGEDPCAEFYDPTPAGRMGVAFRHLTSATCPRQYKLKGWEEKKALQRIHAAKIMKPVQEVVS